MGPGRGWGRPQPEPSSCWREGARGAGRGGAAGRGWDTGTGESLSARSWLALGSPGSEQRPFSRLPPSPLPSLASSLRPPWTWTAARRRQERDADREAPAGGGAAPRAAAPRPKAVRAGRTPGGSADPRPRLPWRSRGWGRGRRGGPALPGALPLGALTAVRGPSGRAGARELGGARPCQRAPREVRCVTLVWWLLPRDLHPHP